MNRVFYFNLTYRCTYSCRYCFSHTTSNHINRCDIDFMRFKEDLLEYDVGRNDRIVLNGGEPTMHPDFMEILDASISSGANIVLYTNGVAFSDVYFARDALSIGSFRVTIPVHGDEPLHDYITQRAGSWKATCAAIKNICRTGKTNCLEPKFIVSDLMAASRFDILRYIKASVITWAALCDVVITGQVNTPTAIRNRIKVSDWGSLMHYAEQEIDQCRNVACTKFFDLPLCYSSERFQAMLKTPIGRENNPILYFSDGIIRPKVVKMCNDRRFIRCGKCSLRHVCTSISSNYYVSALDRNSFFRAME